MGKVDGHLGKVLGKGVMVSFSGFLILHVLEMFLHPFLEGLLRASNI